MAQNRVTSQLDIYNTLTGDTQFMSYVGHYTFAKDDTILDSISIVTPGQKLPALKNQSGLEVLIHDTGIVSRKDYITDASDPLITYQIFLIVWPDATGVTMTNAASRIVQLFSGSRSINIVPAPNELTSLVQTLVLIPDSALITA